MNILGISAFYHDSAACLVRDGDILAAAQEERFTRKKHDFSFPKHAVDFCLSEAGIAPTDLDIVAFYDKPLLKFDRILETYLAYAPRGLQIVPQGASSLAKGKAAYAEGAGPWIERTVSRTLHLHPPSRVACR